MSSQTNPRVLTIAGSDSGGGAGIQADLKTFLVKRVFGTSALTCITAQNPDGVRAIAALEPSMVAAQMEAVMDAVPVAAAKTGMLYSADIIHVVATALAGTCVPGVQMALINHFDVYRRKPFAQLSFDACAPIDGIRPFGKWI